jgi:predicted dehydrogenase
MAIRYGQIGVGHAHASKMSVYRASKDYEVVGVVEPDKARRERAMNSDTYRNLRFVSEEELLNTPGLQLVGVETEVKHLLNTAKKCVDAGKHVHIDKPAGSNLPLFKEILATAAKKHLAVQMGYMYRFNPAIVMLRDFLKKGWLGEPFEVHTVMSKVVGAATRKKLGEYPGGIMFELGCHILDLVIGVLGEPQKVTGFNQHASDLDDKLVDNMLMTLQYPKAIATVKSSAMEVEGFARRHFLLCGTEGTIHVEPLDNPQIRVAFSKAQGPYKKGYQDIKFNGYSRYVGDAADLAKIIRHEKDPEFSYEHDYHVQKTLLEACGLDTGKQ